jgi:hypothetical protein
MRMSLLEWVGRLLGLVLAMMVTLSIIGAIAAIPSSSLDRPFGLDRGLRSEAVPDRAIDAEPLPPSSNREAGDRSPAEPGSSAASARESEPEPPIYAQWLEVIAYSLLARVCLAALVVLLLWRASHQLRRIADRDPGSSP